MKTWQWLVGLGLTVVIAVAGSLWSVAAMRADDMQRLRAAEVEIVALRATDTDMKQALERIERKVDDVRARVHR